MHNTKKYHVTTVDGPQGEKDAQLSVRKDGKKMEVVMDGRSIEVQDLSYQPERGSLSYVANGVAHDYHVISAKDGVFVLRDSEKVFTLQAQTDLEHVMTGMGWTDAAALAGGSLKSPMPGKVLNVMCKEGDEIEKGTPMVVLEAMKMENVLRAEADGRVEAVAVEVGQAVEKGQVLVEVA